MASEFTSGLVTAQAVTGGTVGPREGVKGTVVFRPTVPVFRATDGTLLRLHEEVALRDGVLPLTPLLATTDPDVNPSPFQWVASFYLSNLRLEPVVFDLPAGSTVNVFDLVSLALAPSIEVVVSAADRIAAEMAAQRAADLIASFNPGAEVDLPDLSLYFENGMA